MAGNHGGKRAGAGRKPGSTSRQLVDWSNGALLSDPAALRDIGPLEFLLRIMRDPGATKKTRMEAAKAALPYTAPRPREKPEGDQDTLPLGDGGWGDDLRPN